MYVCRPLSGRAAPRRVTCVRTQVKEVALRAFSAVCAVAAAILMRGEYVGSRFVFVFVFVFFRLRILTLSTMFVGAVCFARVLCLLPRGAMVLMTTLQPCEEPHYAWPRSSATRVPGA